MATALSSPFSWIPSRFLSNFVFPFPCSYALPALVALGAYIARTVFDWTCSHNYCQNSSEFLSHLYAGAVCFIAILASTKTKQLNDFLQMGWAVVGPMVTGVKPKSD